MGNDGRVEGMYGTPGPERSQAVLNWSAPPADVMRALHNHAAVAVTVRVVWDVDGEQVLDGVAVRWWQRHVYVELVDRRLRTTGVWVAAAGRAAPVGDG